MFWLLWSMGCTGEVLDTSAPCDLCQGGCVEHAEPTTREHLDGDLSYEDPPPMGGNHNACWAPWGVHAEAVPEENWVHNLEHGGVAFLYNCPDGCESEIEQLSELVASKGSLALLTPYEQMPYRFATVAWGWRLLQDCLDLETMRVFYNNHVDQGPESTSSAPPEGCM